MVTGQLIEQYLVNEVIPGRVDASVHGCPTVTSSPDLLSSTLLIHLALASAQLTVTARSFCDTYLFVGMPQGLRDLVYGKCSRVTSTAVSILQQQSRSVCPSFQGHISQEPISRWLRTVASPSLQIWMGL